ncbi:MAG TPA: hypothetical protein VGD39_19690 [Nocardioides sp.]
MDFRAAARHLAVDVDKDMDAMSTMPDDGNDLRPGDAGHDPSTDGMDPAAPGGPAPYNGAEPFGEPVTENPEWLDPSDPDRGSKAMPFAPGPHMNMTTLHNARRDRYAQRERRTR